MKVYRIGRSKHAGDLTGEGARLFGGRWNHKGIPCLYTSESRALALLEYSVNVNLDDVPRALTMAIIEISDSSIKIISEAQLPGNWKHAPAPSETKDFGTNLFKNEQFSVFKIPSTVVPEEFNYLLNPLHQDSKLFKLLEIKDFIYDIRIQGLK
jgi:RES domain-containing protein